jgi:hypothetical protein
VTYEVVQIWPELFVCKQVTVCPCHIWTTLYRQFLHRSKMKSQHTVSLGSTRCSITTVCYRQCSRRISLLAKLVVAQLAKYFPESYEARNVQYQVHVRRWLLLNPIVVTRTVITPYWILSFQDIYNFTYYFETIVDTGINFKLSPFICSLPAKPFLCSVIFLLLLVSGL